MAGHTKREQGKFTESGRANIPSLHCYCSLKSHPCLKILRMRRSREEKETEEEERVKFANGVRQTWVVNKSFDALKTLIYDFGGGLMIRTIS